MSKFAHKAHDNMLSRDTFTCGWMKLGGVWPGKILAQRLKRAELWLVHESSALGHARASSNNGFSKALPRLGTWDLAWATIFFINRELKRATRNNKIPKSNSIEREWRFELDFEFLLKRECELALISSNLPVHELDTNSVDGTTYV